MYEAFYGFKEKPFSMLPDPGFLFLSKKHQAALTLLEYGLINHVGFCVISGEAGAGKTTILRSLLERVGDDITVGMITNTHQSFGGLLDWVLSAFDLHRPNLTHVEMHQVFVDYLIEQYASNHTVLLIVDEAQNMKADALEELRMLSNVNSDKDQLMQVVLAGQPSLKDTLRLPELKQFAQRIAVDYHLEALGLKETCGYIQHRLVTAGATKDVFTPAACERIHCYSGGTPRLINLLCETVLVYGFADQQELIDVDLVDEMVQERMKDSVVPIVNRDIVHQPNKEVSEELVKDFPWIYPEGGTEGLKPEPDKSEGEVASLAEQEKEKQEILEEYISPETSDGDPATEQEIIEKSLSVDTEQVTSVKGETSVDDGVKQDASKQVKKTDKIKSAAARAAVATNTSAKPQNNEYLSEDNSVGSQVKKFGMMAGVFAIVLVVLAVVLDDDTELEDIKIEALEMQKQRELEELKLKKLLLEAQLLKKERDEAIAEAEHERLAKQEAEEIAAKKAVAAAKLAEDRRKLESQKQAVAAKERERKAMQAEAEAQAEARYAKREAARLAEERVIMQQRLDEEIRLKQLGEVRRLEMERLELERQQLRSAADSQAASEAVKDNKKKSEECSGPTARFKSGCR